MDNSANKGRWTPGNAPKSPGRPKGSVEFAERIRVATRSGEDLIETAVQFAKGEIRAPASVRMEAVRWLTDRGFGKTPDVNVNVDANATAETLEALSLEDLRALAS